MKVILKLNPPKLGIDHIGTGKFFALYPISGGAPVFIRTDTGAVLVANGMAGHFYPTKSFGACYQEVEAVGKVTFVPTFA